MNLGYPFLLQTTKYSEISLPSFASIQDFLKMLG